MKSNELELDTCTIVYVQSLVSFLCVILRVIILFNFFFFPVATFGIVVHTKKFGGQFTHSITCHVPYNVLGGGPVNTQELYWFCFTLWRFDAAFDTQRLNSPRHNTTPPHTQVDLCRTVRTGISMVKRWLASPFHVPLKQCEVICLRKPLSVQQRNS